GGVRGVDGEEKEVMPGGGGREYIHRGLRRLVVNSVLKLTDLEVADFGGLIMPGWHGRVWRGPGTLAEMLDREQMAHLMLQWDAMGRLNMLFLDLRGYSLPRNSYPFDEDVARLAKSLEENLTLLVIAGLRSWWRYPSPDPIEIEEVEEGVWDPQLEMWVSGIPGVGVNWWRMFSGAVRPGGRLVFVDRQDGNEIMLLEDEP
ncbi:hypothetical protein C8A05DRAFT_20631, partial [Staphylotrichum tortipilum]